MQAIKCELCGNNQLIKKDGFFQCEYCGTKYTLEEARKLFVTGTVQIEGNVSTKDADFVIKAGTLMKYNGESPIVTIPDNVKIIGNECFKDLAIEKVIIPDSITTIEGGAFRNCTKLTSIIIPNSVTTIEGGTFCGCTSLTSVKMPSYVTILGGKVFDNCESLTSIVIPNGTTTIGLDMFFGCKNLTSVTIPNSVTTIFDGAFFGCKNLASITIPNSVTTIGKRAFHACDKLTSVTIPKSVREVKSEAFDSPEQINVESPFDKRVFRCFPRGHYCEYCVGEMKRNFWDGRLKCTRCGKYLD